MSPPLERGWTGEPTPDGGLAFTRRLRGVSERHVIDGPLIKSAEARKLDALADELQAVYQRPGAFVAKDKETDDLLADRAATPPCSRPAARASPSSATRAWAR